jgi:hypothetical protein
MSHGVPLKTISDLLGHASIEMTADIYLHSMDLHARHGTYGRKSALGIACGKSDRQLSDMRSTSNESSALVLPQPLDGLVEGAPNV